MKSKKVVVKRDFATKKGVEIKCGEKVTLTFDVRGKAEALARPENEYLPNYVRMTTDDGRSIITRDFKGAGLRVPGLKKLEWWSFDSVAKSVFGTNVEPDGWSYDGSPSWLLAKGLI